MIAILKLVNGEEIICEADSEDNGVWTVKNPLLLGSHPENGNLLMMSYMPYAETNIIAIPDKSVLFAALPVAALAEQYERKINPNKIITPPAPKIIV